MKTARIRKLFALAALVVATVVMTSASAFAAPVNRLLTGGVVDPMATTLKIVPPRGGTVVVHNNGRAVAWFMRAGFVNLKPNHVYSVTATRGQSMLFNRNVMMRRGYTELVWSRGSQPQMNHVPAYYGASRPRHAASSRRASSRHAAPLPRTSRAHRTSQSRRAAAPRRTQSRRTQSRRTKTQRTKTQRTKTRRTQSRRTKTRSGAKSPTLRRRQRTVARPTLRRI